MKLGFYATLGPACCEAEVLARLIDAGMTGARLNLSHSDIEACEPWINALFAAERLTGVKQELLMDMQGPELRVGELPLPVELKTGEKLPLLSAVRTLMLPTEVSETIEDGHGLLLDDGKLLLEVSGDSLIVKRGGRLSGKKSVAVMGAKIDMPTMTERDKRSVALADSYGVTGLMQPFVRGREDIETVRSEIQKNGGGLKLFAKVENLEGVSRLPEFAALCDMIVIARGDLGNSMPLWELPGVQKRISSLCRRENVPFLVVTELLASMHGSPVPTRAEVSDIYNAVADGASALMLTGETAVGKYPVEAMKYLVKTASSYFETEQGQ